jgi:signal transduction histidine kinase
VRAAPLRTEKSEAPRAIVVAQDVTRFRRIDDLKSDMVATVSHEFKTPLTSLRMATYLLLEPTTGALSDGQREIVTTARDDTERLRALVDELLDLVRIEAEAGMLHHQLVDPVRLLEATVSAHRPIAREKGVSLEIDPGPSGTLCNVDPEKISIVLANLVSNAIRHTPPHGKVTMRATVDRGTLLLRVHDTGSGMPPEELSKWRDRASTSRTGVSIGGRHGLGLTIAQEIVLQHGGDMTVESTEGRGTSITVVLPQERISTPVRSSVDEHRDIR